MLTEPPANYTQQRAWTLHRDLHAWDRPAWKAGYAWPTLKSEVDMPWLTG
jgi:hypothetical protein